VCSQQARVPILRAPTEPPKSMETTLSRSEPDPSPNTVRSYVWLVEPSLLCCRIARTMCVGFNFLRVITTSP
jgi:hypothetical protein